MIIKKADSKKVLIIGINTGIKEERYFSFIADRGNRTEVKNFLTKKQIIKEINKFNKKEKV